MTQNNKYRILFIDDEEVNIRIFQSTFRWDYDIIAVDSAKKGKDIIYNEHIDLIITDQRMPDMSGIEFLESILSDFPDIPKILITGFTDINSIIKAVNEVKIFQYITKPWEKEQVQLVIENAREDAQLKIKNKQLIINLKESNTQLTSALMELDDFIYKASHDLLSPITTILGLSNLAQTEVEKEEKNNYVKKIEGTAKRMKYFLSHLGIVNMIHDKNIEFKKTNLQELLKDYTSYSTEGVQISVEVDENTSCVTDQVLLNIAISQVIENSLKFVHPGRSVSVSIKVTKSETGITLVISDNGIGINKEYSGQYFNMFFKGANSNGSGIGLYLAKKVINKLQGKISIEGDLDSGTTIIIELPSINLDYGTDNLKRESWAVTQ